MTTAEEMRFRLEGEISALLALNRVIRLDMTAEEIIRIIVRRHTASQINLSQLRKDPAGTMREWGLS